MRIRACFIDEALKSFDAFVKVPFANGVGSVEHKHNVVVGLVGTSAVSSLVLDKKSFNFLGGDTFLWNSLNSCGNNCGAVSYAMVYLKPGPNRVVQS